MHPSPPSVTAQLLPIPAMRFPPEGTHQITVQYIDVQTNTVMDTITLNTTLPHDTAARIINFYGQLLLSQTHRPVFVLSTLDNGEQLLTLDQPSLHP